MSRVFDANISNYLSLSSLSISADQDHSFCCYIKPDVVNINQLPMSFGDSTSTAQPRMGLQVNSSGNAEARFQFDASGFKTATSTGSVGTSSWQLLVATWENDATDTYKIYLDSATAQSGTTSIAPSGTMDRLFVGGWADNTPNNPFDGLVAQVMFWSGYLLSSSDVTSLLNATSTAGMNAVQNANLTYHYPLNGSNLSDEEGSGADLTVNGTVASSSDEPFQAVTITDVNTTESWTDGDTGLVITGTGFV